MIRVYRRKNGNGRTKKVALYCLDSKVYTTINEAIERKLDGEDIEFDLSRMNTDDQYSFCLRYLTAFEKTYKETHERKIFIESIIRMGGFTAWIKELEDN